MSSVLSVISTFMPLIVIGVIVLIILGVVGRIRRSEIGMLTSALIREYKRGDMTLSAGELANTPRSLSGMDSIYLPKIARDFPEFSWNQWRDRISAAVLQAAKKRSSDGNAQVYKTVISKYFREEGTCSIIAETGASYMPEQKGSEPPLRKQAVFETELLYIQDEDKVQGRALGVNCPNCGAPVHALGVKKCPYCGTGLEPVNIRVWTIAGIKET